MKKLTAILLATLMLISILVSCGGNDETTTTETPTTEAPTTEAPTTEAPTTEAPTTETPTTEIPTTKPIVTYNIKYELNGGTNNEDNPSTYNTGDTITLSFPTKEDYMFMGWYTDSEFTNEIKEIADKTGDLKLYAKWLPVEEIIEFRLNDENEYVVKRIKNTAKTVIIPSSYKGLPVVMYKYYNFINDDLTDNDVLEEIVFTSGISITKYVSFANATSLKRIIVEEENPYMKSIDGVLYSKDGKELICYPAAKEGTSYVIKDGTESVNRHAFTDNKYIESVVVPDSITFIDAYAFSGCTSLKDVKLSKNLEIIDDCVFQNCVSLKKITIPDSVKSIGHFVFDGCTSLTEVYIPKGVENISYDIFRDAPNVTVYCKAEEKPSGWDTYWHRDAKEVIWGYKAEE